MGDVRGVLIDLDGTTYVGGDPIEGVPEALRKLMHAGIPFRFVTNTTSKPRQVVHDMLAKLGIEPPLDDIFTAATVARDWLRQENLRKCYVLLKENLLEDLDGIEHVTENPEAVILGDLGEQFTYDNLNQAFRFLMDGARLVTLAKNRYFKGRDGLKMDVGAFAAALQYASGAEPILIGKPSREFFLTALASTGVPAEHAAMIGDDLEGDVVGAQQAGLQGILVKTGKFRPEFLEGQAKPDTVLESLADLPEWLGL